MPIRFSSYLTKILLLNLLIMTIPIVFLGVVSYYKSSGLVKEKMNLGSKTILEQTQMQTEQLIKSVDSALTQFAVSELVIQSMDISFTINKYNEVKSITNEMNNLQSYETRIRRIEMVNIRENWYIAQGGIVSLDETSKRDQLKQEFSSFQNSGWSILKAEPGAVGSLRIVKKLPLLSSNPKGFLAADISLNELTRLITRKNELGSIAILNEKFQLLTPADDSIAQVIAASKAPISSAESSGQLNGFFYSSDEKYGVTYSKSTYNGWIYVSVVPTSDITAGTGVIAKITIATCTAVFILTLLISIIGSRRMYSPIGKMYKLLSKQDEHGGPSGSLNEVEHMSKQILNMVQTQSQITNQLRVQSTQLNEYFIIQLLEGTLSRQEIEEKLQSFGLAEYDQFLALTVQIDTLTGTRFESKDYDLILFAIQNMIAEVVPVERRLNPVLLNRSVVLVLANSSMRDSLDLANEGREYAKSIQEAVKLYLELDSSVGVSRVFSDLKDAPTAYHEGLEALDYRIRAGSGVVLHIEDLRTTASPTYIFPKDMENQLLEAIRLADQQKAQELVHALVTEVMLVQDYSYRECQLTLVGVLLELLKFAQQHELDISGRASSQEKPAVDQFFELKSPQEIEAFFCQELVEPLIQELETKRKRQFNSISETLKQIIHEQYHTDLTLESCASIMNFSPDYLRQVFRKHIGITFSDYLNAYRLEMAKQMLTETDMTITEVAERLGYKNPQNFIRSFRKTEGTTPGKYREEDRLHQRENKPFQK
ncbi:helix-turn-helix domain-containing protein [Bacillus sp. 3255]|uniref:helix-turn-helix domain-containing protein n=1 Tax=Bacillus sp. 3255 TaxID=2817904 RepID=UPI00285CC2F0|nr:helix-turn-helix domain-containing protein [Bacillus sp. 3255]MDR6880854.1 AraC-like DNA-binding protein [Bacillus sp. 3255]